MDAFLIFLTVFITLISSACTALLVPLRQRRFLAKGIPMLVLNIVGYALAVFIWAIVPTLYYRVGIDTDVLFVIPMGIAIVFVVAVVIVEFVCGLHNRQNQGEEVETEEEQLIEEEPVAEQSADEQVDVQPEEEQVEEVTEEVQDEPVEEPVQEATAEENAEVERVEAEEVQPEQEQPAEENSDKE